MNLTPHIQQALNTSARLHTEIGQVRKGSNLPYIVHPVSVAIIVSNYTDDEEVIAAALLHDVLEDVPSSLYSAKDMEHDFGTRVLSIVQAVSEPKKAGEELLSWKERKTSYLDQLEHAEDGALFVAAGDKIHNIQTSIADFERIGEELWTKFAAGREETLWFYGAVLEVLERRLKSPIVVELDRVLSLLKSVGK